MPRLTSRVPTDLAVWIAGFGRGLRTAEDRAEVAQSRVDRIASGRIAITRRTCPGELVETLMMPWRRPDSRR